ncbi:MAG: hypothetical protein IT319_20265, partial [Anaerolineae bacterium]|nr:hypothetical protein [Anaerolineae bacterium]
SDLEPFVERLFDEMLVGMVLGLKIAGDSWASYNDMAIHGNRVGALTALAQATDAVSTISPTLAGWLNQLRTVVNNAGYIERHALYGILGRALADGWEHYDRGRLADAERLGVQAYEIARNDSERSAARRLRDLAEQSRDWVERNGINDVKRTQNALMKIELLYTADEIGARDNFAAQMPSKDTFLKAMNKGLIDQFVRESSSAVRILFFNYILLGALDAHENQLDDAAFWRDAAMRTLGDLGAKHPTTRTLEEYTQRRRDLKAATDLLTSINGPHALPTLESSRRALEENPQARVLAPALFSLRELEAATRDWSDGEFRAAGIKIENAVRAVDEVESSAGITLTQYRAWLRELMDASTDLHANSRRMSQIVDSKPTDPPETVRQLQRTQVDVTTRLLGEAYAGNMRQWLNTYEQFLAIYTDPSLRRSVKLTRFNDLFRAMFIDRHPAYPLYRHWYNLVEQAPEFPAPPTSEPTPRITEVEDEEEDIFRPFVRVEPPEPPDDDEDDEPEARPPRRIGRALLVIALGLVILVAIGAVIVSQGGLDGLLSAINTTPTVEPTIPSVVAATTDEVITETPEDAAPTIAPTSIPVEATMPGLSDITATLTRTPTPTLPPSDTPEPTETPTDAPTETPTPTDTPTPTSTSSPTLPPGGLRGDQDLFRAVNSMNAPGWSADEFSFDTEDGYWRLGTGAAVPGGTVIEIPIPQPVLEAMYGNNAADRIVSVEAELELVTFNPPLLIDNLVFFGMMLKPINNPSRAVGAQVQIPEAGVLNIGQRIGDSVTISMQRSVGSQIARIRLVRDLNGNLIVVYVNDEQVGPPLQFAGRDNPVIPVLYVHAGGVIVHVNRWRVTLQ